MIRHETYQAYYKDEEGIWRHCVIRRTGILVSAKNPGFNEYIDRFVQPHPWFCTVIYPPEARQHGRYVFEHGPNGETGSKWVAAPPQPPIWDGKTSGRILRYGGA